MFSVSSSQRDQSTRIRSKACLPKCVEDWKGKGVPCSNHIGRPRSSRQDKLKKSFLGLPFDPEEDSTDGIEVDPSKFEVHIDHVKNWKRTDEELSVSQFALSIR